MDKNFLTPYRSTQWQEKKNTILTRDSYTCVICGKRGDENTLMHVHHLTCKNGKVGDCPDEDLVTLCEDCHKQVHSGKPFESAQMNYAIYRMTNLSILSRKCISPIATISSHTKWSYCYNPKANEEAASIITYDSLLPF